MSFTVAIDGPAAAGKGTIARTIAARFGFAHLDTGLLYRATGRRVLDGLEPVEAALRLSPDDLARPDLRSAEVATAASRVAAVPDVRRILLDFQRKFALTEPGAVLDGRDIGTVICPDADVKLYVTASAEVRARRRLDELLTSGFDTIFDEVLADVEARDARDMERADAPLRAAADASTIDTTDLSIEEAVARAVGVVSERHDAR